MKIRDAVSQARLCAFKGELGKHLSWILLEEELNIFKRNSIHVYSNGTKAFLNLKKKKRKLQSIICNIGSIALPKGQQRLLFNTVAFYQQHTALKFCSLSSSLKRIRQLTFSLLFMKRKIKMPNSLLCFEIMFYPTSKTRT